MLLYVIQTLNSPRYTDNTFFVSCVYDRIDLQELKKNLQYILHHVAR